MKESTESKSKDATLNSSANAIRPQMQLYSEARAEMGWLAMELGCVTLTELGRRFNRDVGTMGSGARRVAERSRQDPKLRNRLAVLKSISA